MILSFRVKNFRSFAGDAVLSMRPVKAYKEYKENICRHNNVDVLKIAGVYGANASGKSNLVKAIAAMRHIVLDSLRRSSVDKIDVESFELDARKAIEPTEFDIEMLTGNHVYRYGFSVTRKRVVAEWLFRSLGGPRSASRVLFIREGNSILDANNRLLRELGHLDMKTLLPNALLLPRLDQLNSTIGNNIMQWFSRLNVLSGSRSSDYDRYSARHFGDSLFHDTMMRIMRFADSSIADVVVDTKELGADEMPPHIRMRIPQNAEISLEARIVLVKRLGKQGDMIPFDLDDKESEGTIKMFELSGPLTDILNTGSILVIDEMEAKLHPLLTRRLVRLFRSAEWNPKNAQLVFVTHDATLLRHAGLRRDQIWFCEKNRACESELYCLTEIKSGAKARQEDNLEKKYLEGRFGAVPRFVDAVRLKEEMPNESKADEEN